MAGTWVNLYRVSETTIVYRNHSMSTAGKIAALDAFTKQFARFRMFRTLTMFGKAETAIVSLTTQIKSSL